METRPFLPKLRFPEFRLAAAWSPRCLGDLFAERQESGFTNLPLLSVTDKEGVIPQAQTKRKDSSNIDRSKYLRVVPGDIAYNTMRMWEGRSALVGMEGVVSPAYTVCKPIAGSNSRFFSFYFKTPQLIENFKRLSQGLVKDTLNLKYHAFSRISTPVPTFEEQQKIAECLTSVDELIGAEARKLEALRTYKEALMQSLFPPEGETTPRLSFIDRSDWSEGSFEDLIFFQEGPGIMAVDFRSEGVPLVRLSGLSGQQVSLDGCNYLDPEKVERTWNHFRLVAGDLLVSCSASFGSPAIVTEAVAGSIFYTGLVRFRPKDDRLTHGYLESFLGSSRFGDQCESLAVGSGMKHFGPTHLKQMKVPFPSNTQQDRIASCLGSLDSLITEQANNLDSLKTHKRGLMQSLFPG